MTSALVHVVAVLAAAVVSAALFFALCAIAACVGSSRISRRESRHPEDPSARNTGPITAERDPIALCPDRPIAVTPLAPVIPTNQPFTIWSPITNTVIAPEIRQ